MTLVLTRNGFAIKQKHDHRIVFTGPGMTSTKQNPLLGASKLDVEVFGKDLKLTAELGGVQRMSRFVRWFPLILCLFLATVFLVVGLFTGLPFFNQPNQNNAGGFNWMIAIFAMCMLPALPWLFIAPIMIRWIREKTNRALETLVKNAVNAPE